MVIIWSTPAIKDLENFKNITKKLNVKEYLNNLVEYVDTLKLNPRLGKVYTYIKGTIIRQLIYQEHKIYYSLNNDELYILAIIHSRQDTKQRLKYIKDSLN